jgi:hypothetical protein
MWQFDPEAHEIHRLDDPSYVYGLDRAKSKADVLSFAMHLATSKDDPALARDFLRIMLMLGILGHDGSYKTRPRATIRVVTETA